MPGHSHSQSGSGQQYAQQAQASRNASYGMSGPATAQTTYRGIAANPVPQYSFTSTPALSSSGQWQPYGALRTSSSPSLPTTQTIGGNMATRPQYQQHASMTNLPTSARIPSQGMARDDSSLPSGTKQQMMPASQPTFAQVASGKAAPDRYRRPAQRAVADSSSSASSQSQTSSSMSGSAMPSGSGMATVVHLYNPRAGGQRMPIHRNSATLAARPHSLYGYVPGQHAADDMLIQRQPTEEELRRFRRRSMHSIDTSDYPILLTPQELKQQTEAAARRARKVSISDKNQKASPRVVPVPAGGNNTNSSTVQTRNGSSESLVSSRSSNSRPSSVSAPIISIFPMHCPISGEVPHFLSHAHALCHSSLPIETPTHPPPLQAPPRQLPHPTTSPTTTRRLQSRSTFLLEDLLPMLRSEYSLLRHYPSRRQCLLKRLPNLHQATHLLPRQRSPLDRPKGPQGTALPHNTLPLSTKRENQRTKLLDSVGLSHLVVLPTSRRPQIFPTMQAESPIMMWGNCGRNPIPMICTSRNRLVSLRSRRPAVSATTSTLAPRFSLGPPTTCPFPQQPPLPRSCSEKWARA